LESRILAYFLGCFFDRTLCERRRVGVDLNPISIFPLEKGNPQSRLGYPSNYGFTVIHETIPRKKGSFSGISNPRFSRVENEASNSIPRD
jgi:hypothetical protein